MANDFPNLLVYTHMQATPSFIEDIAPYAQDYEHTLRLIGGYWSASWKLDRAVIGDFLYNEWKIKRLWGHFVEDSRGQRTWEGFISEITPDDEKGIIQVMALGYVHTIQNQYANWAPSGTTDANAWLELIRANDTEYIQSGRLDANPIQCRTYSELQAWDEMQKITSLGDTDGNPWQIGVYNERRLYYQKIDVTPAYYVRGGIKWRTNLNDVYNTIQVIYTDEAGSTQPNVVDTNDESIALYGTRELKLNYNTITTVAATALAATAKKQYAWPIPKAIGSARGIQVYDRIGSNATLSPWKILPGVYRDMTISEGTARYQGWLTGAGDFLVSEVCARADGVQLRSTDYDEAEILEKQMEYEQDYMRELEQLEKSTPTGGGGTTSGGGGGGSRGRWPTPVPKPAPKKRKKGGGGLPPNAPLPT